MHMCVHVRVCGGDHSHVCTCMGRPEDVTLRNTIHLFGDGGLSLAYSSPVRLDRLASQ